MPEVLDHFAIKRNATGDIAREVIYVPLHQLKITFLSPEGDDISKNEVPLVIALQFEFAEPLRAFLFRVEGPGIDTERVSKVRLPDLDYSSKEVLMVAVEMFIKEEEE